MPPIDHVTGNPAVVLMLDEALYAAHPPSFELYAQQFTALITAYPNAAAYANAIVSSGFGTLSDSALATLVLGNLINPSYGSVTPALQAAVTAAFAANPANRGAVVLQLAQLLDGLVGDATYGPAATQWRMKIAGDYTQLTYSSPSYFLTAGPDALVGDSSDNVFVGTETMLQTGDSIDGRGGTDTLKVAAAGPQPVQFSGFTTTSVEQLQVISDAVSGTRISTAGMAGTTRLTNDNSSTDVTFADMDHITSLTLQNVSGGSTSLAFAPQAVQGNADTLAVDLSNNKQINGSAIGGLYANGIETINISTRAGDSKLAEVASPGSLTLLNISGDKDLTIGLVNFNGPGHSGAVNAVNFTGRLTLGLGTLGDTERTVFVVGGRGVDTLRLAGNAADYSVTPTDAKVDFGAHLHNVHAASSQAGNVELTSVERLQFNDGSLALDMRSGQSGYLAVEMLGAALGANGPADKAGAGALLAYFDTGGTLAGAAQLLLDTGYLVGKAGATSAADVAAIARFVYTNVNGQAPLPDILAGLLTPITSHSITLAQWIATMAASPENQVHVQLTGYAQTGLAYV